jgi:hypothetical protein
MNMARTIAIILAAFAIAAVGVAVYQSMPYRDRVSIENPWKAPIP